MKKVFIDGRAGTTGMNIFDRLSKRADISILQLSEAQRKNTADRQNALNECDIAFLCLPDAAAVEAVSLVQNPNTVIIDSSTAHRTCAGWLYGFPELYTDFSQKVDGAKRIAVPGCHAGGFIALVKPLVECGVLPAEALLCCHSLTGYSGGGKKMIEKYNIANGAGLTVAPEQYGLSQTHKHLREMTAITNLLHEPVFSPIVADFYSGMEMTVMLFADNLCEGKTVDDIRNIYRSRYNGPIVSYTDNADEGGFLSAGLLSCTDKMLVSVYGNGRRILLTAVYDNLGKGACGAAIECLNYVLGVPPETGLIL